MFYVSMYPTADKLIEDDGRVVDGLASVLADGYFQLCPRRRPRRRSDGFEWWKNALLVRPTVLVQTSNMNEADELRYTLLDMEIGYRFEVVDGSSEESHGEPDVELFCPGSDPLRVRAGECVETALLLERLRSEHSDSVFSVRDVEALIRRLDGSVVQEQLDAIAASRRAAG